MSAMLVVAQAVCSEPVVRVRGVCNSSVAHVTAGAFVTVGDPNRISADDVVQNLTVIKSVLTVCPEHNPSPTTLSLAVQSLHPSCGKEWAMTQAWVLKRLLSYTRLWMFGRSAIELARCAMCWPQL